MDINYFLNYAIASAVCILIFGILLVNDKISMNRQEKQIKFDHALIAHILYFVSDIVWAAIVGGIIPKTHFSVAFVNFSNFVLLPLIAYEWSLFAASSEKLSFIESSRGRMLFRLPIAFMTTAMFVAYIIAPYFWVGEAGELNDLYYIMFLIAPVTYLVTSCVQSLIKAHKTEDPSEKKLFRMIGLYPLAIIVFGIIQLAYASVPLFCFGCTIMMLFFYIRSMQDQVSLDPLTKLNNRGQLIKYAAQEAAHRKDDVMTYIFMVDANDFKQINDTYGHAEGDRALIMIAEALKSCTRSAKNQSFICRYGGDEFAMIVHAEEPDDASRLAEDINKSLADSDKEEMMPYRLTVSIGYDEWKTDSESFQDCLRRADEKLYNEKRKRKQGL